MTNSQAAKSESASGQPKSILDPIVFGVTAVLVGAFVAWALLGKDSFNTATGNALDWIVTNLGWLFILSATGFVLFALYLAFSKYGRIPLGLDGEKPEYRTLSWISMMFACGMGIGLMFYGSYEPLYHFVEAPPEMAAEDVRTAMATTMFHWGFHPWAIYAVVGLAIAYGTFRCGRSQLISSAFEPLIGSKASKGVPGKIIDILAIFATLFGTVASLGLGALQIGKGVDFAGWIDNPGALLLVAIVAILTAAFVASAVSGVAKGIQFLSNTNMVLAMVLAIFIFVVGPTIFIMNLLPTGLGAYINELPFLSARSGAVVGEDGESWLASWTIFYWAWWVSWTPFVGMFLAKISKGRSIREFVIGVMVVPTSVSLLWFAIFGGTALSQQMTGELGFTADSDPEATLFDITDPLPLAGILTVLIMVLISIFFITGADSASLVMGTLSERGRGEPRRQTTIFWGVLVGTVAATLLWAGGTGDDNEALTAIQQTAIIAGLPFVLVMIGMCLSLYKDLRRDPLIVSREVLSHQFDDHIRKQAEVIGAGEWDSLDPDVLEHVEAVGAANGLENGEAIDNGGYALHSEDENSENDGGDSTTDTRPY